MHKIRFRPGSASDPAGGAYDAPPAPVDGEGTQVPTFPPRSRRIRNKAVIGLHDNGFPGPVVALDGPGYWKGIRPVRSNATIVLLVHYDMQSYIGTREGRVTGFKC